jgi:hypothetical protein
MDIVLTAEETRVLGALIEKEITTPEYYPLSLNALVNACNQKSCREPVVHFDEANVARAVESLRDRQLMAMVAGADARVPKYKQRLTELHPFGTAGAAILAELLLRGPQTAGELKNRASRMHPFADGAEVQAVLDELARRSDGPWVALLPRQAGQKELRYTHLLNGPAPAAGEAAALPVEPAVLAVRQESERLAQVEQQVVMLRADLEQLRQQLAEFRKQFE